MTPAELATDIGTRIADLCADPDRATRSYAICIRVLSTVLEQLAAQPPSPVLPTIWTQTRIEALRDGLALMTMGLSPVGEPEASTSDTEAARYTLALSTAATQRDVALAEVSAEIFRAHLAEKGWKRHMIQGTFDGSPGDEWWRFENPPPSAVFAATALDVRLREGGPIPWQSILTAAAVEERAPVILLAELLMREMEYRAEALRLAAEVGT